MIHSRTIRILATALSLALPTAAALAQTPHPASAMTGMHGTNAGSASQDTPGTAPGQEASPSTSAFQAADKAMMQKMSAPYTGDTDKDFVAHMMPHHEGAVAMARIELQYGKDPALKRLAREIVRSQNREIAFMKKWQAQHGVQP